MTQQPSWPKRVLQAAAIYNLLWGAWVVLFPNHWFDLTGIPHPNYPGIWQCVGMIVGVYGLGYWWASRDYAKHWPVIAVGFLGKIFGPIGFLQSVIQGALPWSWGWMILTNDLIWWLPFGAMLYLAFKQHSDPQQRAADSGKQAAEPWSLADANTLARTAQGQTIGQLSSKKDVLLIFLRHAGCTFCRETLDELRKSRQTWEQQGLQPVVVHMGSNEQGLRMMDQYQLDDCPIISDPECRIFRAYQLPRGTWRQLFGLRIWIEGFKAAILKGYGFGKLMGDGFQMSGAFVVRDGRIVVAYPSKDAADSCSWKPALQATVLMSLLLVDWASQPAFAQATGPVPGPVPDLKLSVSNPQGVQAMADGEISEIQQGDCVEFATEPRTAQDWIIDIHSQRGIGGFTLRRRSPKWPENLRVRIHTKGLEQIRLVIGPKTAQEGMTTTYSGEYGTTSLKEIWSEIQQHIDAKGETITTTRQVLLGTGVSGSGNAIKSLRLMDASGRELEKKRLPLKEGEYFHWTVPNEWLAKQNPEVVQIQWVDFFRG